MRVQSLVTAAAASVLVVALGALAGIVSHLSSGSTGCADCGVVVAVRPVQLKAKTVTVRYQIRVRMSDGSVKTLTSSTPPAWKAGDRVRLQNGRLVG